MASKCRHCQHSPANRPRGLCHRCSKDPEIREQYPSGSKFGRRGVGNGNCNTAPPEYPTDAEPGSEEKILVMIDRVTRREDLSHERDRRYGSASLPWEVPHCRECLDTLGGRMPGGAEVFDSPSAGATEAGH